MTTKKLNYDNQKHLQEFAKALLIVKRQLIVPAKDIILLEGGCDKYGFIDYLYFRIGDIHYDYRNDKLDMMY